MKIKDQSKFTNIYFYSILVIGTLLTFGGNKNIDKFGLLFYMLTGFPIFSILFYTNLYQFSKQLKNIRPDLFEKYKLNYTTLKGEVISTISLFNNSDFKKLDPKELREKYKLTIKTFKFNILSFVLIIPLAIGQILLKKLVEGNTTVNLSQQNYDTLPNESSKNVKFLYSDSAHIRSMLTAPQLDRFKGKANYFEFPKGIKMIFYNNKYPNEQSKLTADFGIGYDNGNGIERMEAKRNVVMINEKGDKLITEQLTWDALTRKFYTDKHVTITTKDGIIDGDGLVSNEDFSVYEIKKNVTGHKFYKNE